MSIDTDVLGALLGRFGDAGTGDPGAGDSGSGDIVIGHRLGLYRALADGPLTAVDLAARTGTRVRPVRAWLHAQAAGGHVTATDDGRFFLFPEPDGRPGGVPERPGERPVPPGAGPDAAGWRALDEDVFLATEDFFRPGFVAHVVTDWIPALRDVEPRLRAGGRIADVGCRLGSASIVMALAYPAARVRGCDHHAGSVELARERAARAAVDHRVTFEVASATAFTGTGYDLVTSYDCRFDRNDPVAAGRHVRSAIGPEGCWMLVEPTGSGDLASSRDPVGRLWALGARSGDAAVTEMARAAGFRRCDRVAGTRSADVYAIRP